jgi:hypothetical protein
MHRAATDHDEAEQGDLLEGDDLAALLFPMGLEVVFLIRWPARGSIQSGSIFATMRAYSLVVSTSSAAMIHCGRLRPSPDDGCTQNRR